jgi:hypothetical protein
LTQNYHYAASVLFLLCFLHPNPTGPVCTHVGSICSTAKDRRLEMLPVLRIGMQGLPYQDNSNNMQQMQGTIKIQTNFIHNVVLNCIILFSKLLGIILHKYVRNEKFE